MSSFLKLFDVGKSQYEEKGNKLNDKPNIIKQRNGIYRTIRVSKSSNDIHRNDKEDGNVLKVFKPENNLEGLNNNTEEKFIELSKSSKNNSDIVFYKRKIPSHLDSDDEQHFKIFENDINDYEDEDDEEYDDEDNILVDVLPSFQFYDSLVKFLPDDKYEDLDNCDLEDNILLSPVAVGEENIFDSFNNNNNPPEYDTPVPLGISNLRSEPIESINYESSRYEVDNIHKLPQITLVGLDIRINLTKNAVKPNTPLEKESSLREFSSGEIINGFFTVINRTSKPIRFEGLYVSFEGTVNLKNKENHKTSKMRFLKTHDLSATWSYSHVEIASGVGYSAGVVDRTDNSRLGLPNNKILKPNVKYKKYFCFKIPTEILDRNCKHQLPQHLGLPPSFGLNKFAKENAFIRCHEILGYGHNGLKGSPILCPDLASYDETVSHELRKHLPASLNATKKLKTGFENEGSSISYSINCRLVVKDENSMQPCVLNDTVYYIRIIPNTLTSNKKYKYTEGKSSDVDLILLQKKLLQFNNNVINRTEYLDTLLQKLEHWVDDTTFNKADFSVQRQDIIEKKQAQELKETKISWKDLHLQRDNLHSKKNLRNSKKILFANSYEESKDLFKTTVEYHLGEKKRSNSFEVINSFFASQQNTNLEGINTSAGAVLIEIKLNKDLKALPYHRTSSIEHYNTIDKKINFNKKLWFNEIYPQLPAQREEYLLDHLVMKLTLKSNDLKNVPKLKLVTAFLVSYTCYTDREMPLVLDSQFIMKEGQLLKQISTNSKANINKIEQLKSRYERYKDRLDFLAKKFNIEPSDVRFDVFINNLMLSDLESFANLNIEQFELRNIFQTTDLSAFGWVSKGDCLECYMNVNLKYKKNLLLAILPTFYNCLISRFYHLEIECEFDSGDKAKLKIPVDVKYF
ncbi:hypothetical protein QEN19_000593 [Hanseniaspora menglaensis]